VTLWPEVNEEVNEQSVPPSKGFMLCTPTPDKEITVRSFISTYTFQTIPVGWLQIVNTDRDFLNSHIVLNEWPHARTRTHTHGEKGEILRRAVQVYR